MAGILVVVAFSIFLYKRSEQKSDTDYFYVTFRCLDKRCGKGALRFLKEEIKDFDKGDTTYIVTFWARAEIDEDQTTTPDMQSEKKLFLSATPDTLDPRFLDTLKIVILNISEEKPAIPKKENSR